MAANAFVPVQQVQAAGDTECVIVWTSAVLGPQPRKMRSQVLTVQVNLRGLRECTMIACTSPSVVFE